MPKKICFVDLTSLGNFNEQLNLIRKCTTPGCNGNIVPMSVKGVGLGGAITIHYTCSGCVMKFAQFEASAHYDGVGSGEYGGSFAPHCLSIMSVTSST